MNRYSPYQLFYDKFIGGTDDLDGTGAIFLVVYSLEREQAECVRECVYW